ncbi:hypothetical protein JCM9533A_67070 [Catenuloplanes niger JCM 9533]
MWQGMTTVTGEMAFTFTSEFTEGDMRVLSTTAAPVGRAARVSKLAAGHEESTGRRGGGRDGA